MSFQWSISHPMRVVLALVKGELQRGEVLAFVAAIDAEKALIYPKILDISRLTTIFPTDRLLTFAHIARLRETTSAAGPIALVAGTGPQLAQAQVFAEAGQLVRPIRVFVEHHQARRWVRELARPASESEASQPAQSPVEALAVHQGGGEGDGGRSHDEIGGTKHLPRLPP